MGTFVMDQGIMTLVTVGIIAACAILVLYALYSVIWRAVRRGLREFHQPATTHVEQLTRRIAITKVPDYPPRDWV